MNGTGGKRTVDDLAVFGGVPAFARVLHVGRPNLGDTEGFLARARDVFARRWLSNNGRYVHELEGRIASLLGVRHCVATCNATVALSLAARALGLTGEVILPSYTFVATAHSLLGQSIRPCFCDVDPRTHCLDPDQVESLITPRTSGILGVHLWGRPCAPEALAGLARRRGLKLLFDAAHAFACSHKGRMIGGFGDAEVLSFHATKFVTAGEGGAVVTNDDELAWRLRRMINFGFEGIDDVVCWGTNGKMAELAAALALTNLESLGDIVRTNARHYAEYRTRLATTPGLTLLPFDPQERCNYQYVVVEVDPARAGLTRDQLVEILWAENVRARKYYSPGCHDSEPYRTHFPDAGSRLPHTRRLSERVMALPTGQQLEPGDVERLVGVLRFAVEHGSAVRERFGRAGAPIRFPPGVVLTPPGPVLP
jgi:dTDP-4-amino-4,6-dideoxygalactose transaminase